MDEVDYRPGRPREDDLPEDVVGQVRQQGSSKDGWRSSREERSRLLGLIAVCTLSIGSHFGTYLLGPLKSRLHREMGTSNSQFSLLVASFNLNSTWTPFVGGIFVSKFGTAWSSVATTGCVLAGQAILLVGVVTEHLVIMAIGLFIFGLGLTPLMVVQETLVSHLSTSAHIGISLALGLVSGKSSAFIASLVSFPLADHFGDAVPFIVAVLLCSGSFLANWTRLARGWGKEAGEAAVHGKRMVEWAGIRSLGDVYWVYIFLNVLSGAIWQPFLHLSANLVQTRYGVSEQVASTQAAVLLAGAIFLYPMVGHITDRFDPFTPRTTFHLILVSSTLTLLSYTYLSIPAEITGTSWPGMIFFALGHGSATLLFVIVVPRILPAHLVPIGLGIHKSMEMAASSFSQTVSGLWLDHARATTGSGQAGGEGLLRTFWAINLLQLLCAVGLWRFEARRRGQMERSSDGEYVPVSTLDQGPEEYELADDAELDMVKKPHHRQEPIRSAVAASPSETARGRISFMACCCLVALVWALFLVVAIKDL